MIVPVRVTGELALTFKEVRLTALRETPSAFGSTYARESRRSDAEWLRFVERWDGSRSAGYLAMEAGEACGMAAGFLDEADATRAHLRSMWVAAQYRRRGVGRLLVEAVLDWARSREVGAVQLMVTSSNSSAIRFYESLGFAFTGKTEAYPNDAALVEYEMSRAVR